MLIPLFATETLDKNCNRRATRPQSRQLGPAELAKNTFEFILAVARSRLEASEKALKVTHDERNHGKLDSTPNTYKGSIKEQEKLIYNRRQ